MLTSAQILVIPYRIYDAFVFETSATTDESSFGAPTTNSSPQAIQARAEAYTYTPQHIADHIVDPIVLGVSAVTKILARTSARFRAAQRRMQKLRVWTNI